MCNISELEFFSERWSMYKTSTHGAYNTDLTNYGQNLIYELFLKLLGYWLSVNTVTV
jgi:hypothetical protein